MQANPWIPSNRKRLPASLMEPIEEAGCWYPDELGGSDAHIYRLSAGEIAEIEEAVRLVQDRSVPIKEITRSSFPLPGLAASLADIQKELMEGRGYALIRGYPIDGKTRFETVAAFWGVSSYIGAPFSQNGEGHLLGHVTDQGKTMKSDTGRGYQTNEELEFHADGCDITSLFCLQTSKAGGQHRLCSSVAVHNEMLRRRPELVEALGFHFYRSRRGAIPVGESKPWFRQPVFSIKDGYFTARGASNTITRAQKLPGVPALTPIQLEAMQFYQQVARELAIDIDFERGDMSYAQSHVTLHSRTSFEDWPEPERKRHLLRLWMRAEENKRPLVPEVALEVRRGITLEGVELTVPLEP